MIVLLIFLFIPSSRASDQNLEGPDLLSALLIINTTSDIIHDTDQRISELEFIKQDNYNTAPFEVGYVTYFIQDKYRKMVDKYNTSNYMRVKLYVMELVLYLEEIERHYWQIEHLANMLHEIENKFGVKGGFGEPYVSMTNEPFPVRYATEYPPKRIDPFDMKKFWKRRNKTMHASTRKPKYTKKMWDLDYGWEIDYYW